MDYVKDAANLQPLVILSPIDFPFPPSVEFCELMKANGFRAIFIRRLGFGGTPALPAQLLTDANIKAGATVMAETAVILSTITHMQLQNIVLLGISSANPICYRLCQMHQSISLSIFSHPIFNQDTFETLRPVWLQPIARQIVLTKTGFKLAARGLRFHIKRDPIGFYDQLYSKSSADLKYRQDNEADFLTASEYVRRVTGETLFYDAYQTLSEDSYLRDGLFLNVPAVALLGAETTKGWLSRAEAEAERLGLPVAHSSTGGILTAYASPKVLIKTIRDYLA